MIVPSLLLMTQLALFYPRRHTPVWRWDPPWWLTFVVTSMLRPSWSGRWCELSFSQTAPLRDVRFPYVTDTHS